MIEVVAHNLPASVRIDYSILALLLTPERQGVAPIMQRLAGKIAIITGATSGMGRHSGEPCRGGCQNCCQRAQLGQAQVDSLGTDRMPLHQG